MISLQLPGAGGYGDPRDRSLDAIDRDLLDEKVSLEQTEENYGVVVDRTLRRVDRAATAADRGGSAAAE